MNVENFQIGQRVTIARPVGNKQLIGAKATIMSGIDEFKIERGPMVKGYWIEIDGISGKPFVAEESELDLAV